MSAPWCLLVSHNAGGAALLASWAAHHMQEYRFECLLSGPAVAIFSQRLSAAFLITRSAVEINKYTLLITGTSSAETGWETVLLAGARTAGVPTISLLDHWTNYTSRFLWQGNYIFPDHLWVSDSYAMAQVEQCQQITPNYPKATQITNFYLLDQVEYIRKNKFNASGEQILFVSEPSYNSLYTAQQALADFLQYVYNHLNHVVTVRLRLHPREALSEYQILLHDWADKLSIELSANGKLEDDLCWATWVVGCQTMAMVVAQAAGIKVASCLPACVAKSALPHSEIPRLFIPKEQG